MNNYGITQDTTEMNFEMSYKAYAHLTLTNDDLPEGKTLQDITSVSDGGWHKFCIEFTDGTHTYIEGQYIDEGAEWSEDLTVYDANWNEVA